MKKIFYIKLSDAAGQAKKIAARLKGGEVLALVGPLGSGKTTFAKALGKQLGIKQRMNSPTFTLMHIFPLPSGKQDKAQKLRLYHLDLYRLKNWTEARALGLPEFWGQKNAITIIEWADKIKKYLPKKTTFIYFSHV